MRSSRISTSRAPLLSIDGRRWSLALSRSSPLTAVSHRQEAGIIPRTCLIFRAGTFRSGSESDRDSDLGASRCAGRTPSPDGIPQPKNGLKQSIWRSSRGGPSAHHCGLRTTRKKGIKPYGSGYLSDDKVVTQRVDVFLRKGVSPHLPLARRLGPRGHPFRTDRQPRDLRNGQPTAGIVDRALGYRRPQRSSGRARTPDPNKTLAPCAVRVSDVLYGDRSPQDGHRMHPSNDATMLSGPLLDLSDQC